jgi:hypothetical protein
MALSNEDKALVVAFELLRKQLHDSAAATAANTQRTEDDYREQAKALRELAAKLDTAEGRAPAPGAPPPGGPAPTVNPNQAALADWQNDPERKERNAARQLAGAKKAERGQALNASPLFGVLGQVAAKFAAVVGPAALLGQVLNSQISGFQVLGTATKVLAATIAPVLLPATVALSAGVLALSDVIMDHGLPVMDRWFDYVLGTAIPAIAFLIDTIDDAGKGVEDFAEAVEDAVNWVERKINSLNPFSESNPDERRFLGVKWSDRGTGEAGVNAGLADTLRSLRMSMGPRAQITGIGDVGRGAQLASIQADPLEARLMRDQLKVLEKIEAKLPGRAAPRRVYDPGETTAGGGADYGEGD